MAYTQERKPRVDPRIPTGEINRWLGRVHVGTPDAEVEAELRAQIDRSGATWTEAMKRQAVRYALWRHHENLGEYQWVMGGGHHRSRLFGRSASRAVRRHGGR